MTQSPANRRAPSFEQRGTRVALTAGQQASLDQAEKLAGSSKLADLRLAAQIVRELEAEIGARLEMSLVTRGIVETVNLEVRRVGDPAVARDDLVDMSPKAGYCRMKDRDGLRSLFEVGRIGGSHYAAGCAYRRLHEEASSGGGKSQLDDRVRSTTVDVVGIGFKRAKATTLKTRIDIAVAVRLKADPVALQSLRLVAGEGRSVRSIARGRAFDRTVKSLIDALGVASEILSSK